MDIGEQKRVIQVEPEPLRRPEFDPGPEAPAPAPASRPAEEEPVTVPAGPPAGNRTPGPPRTQTLP